MAHLSLLLFLLPILSTSASDTTFIYAGCSQPKYPPNSAYAYTVSTLLNSLSNVAAFSSYANFSFPTIHALLQCRADLSSSHCQSCTRSALTQLPSLCPSATGAAIQLSGCFIRYGNDSFLGRPDTSLVYKSCGPASDKNSSAAAIAAMQAAPAKDGTYRAGAAGDAQAMSQCVGDLSVKECSDCVSNAAGQLRDSCGGAVSGDLYLGKCYVRYWSDGEPYSSHSGHGNDGAKTYAIVIGLIAGVALVIVFLSFIRKAIRGKKY